MKILTLGNSFAQDSHRWLHDIAKADNVDIKCENLHIPGCSLERHYNNIIGNIAGYDLEINGKSTWKKISINDAIKSDDWDIITMQQASKFSGLSDSYDPYFDEIYNYIKDNAPNAKIYIFETWAYEFDYDHPKFEPYNFNQSLMHDMLKKCYYDKAKEYGLDIIPVGDAIKYFRENVKEFDYKNGGLSLNRDGFHLSYNYGRFIAGLVWYHTLTGNDVKNNSFIPEIPDQITNKGLINIIKSELSNWFKFK